MQCAHTACACAVLMFKHIIFTVSGNGCVKKKYNKKNCWTAC